MKKQLKSIKIGKKKSKIFYCNIHNLYMYTHQRWIQRRARALMFKIFYGCIFGNFDFITRINFIVINMQCL